MISSRLYIYRFLDKDLSLNSTYPYSSFSMSLSDLMDEYISTAEQFLVLARIKAMISHPASPCSQFRDHLPIS